MQDYNYDAELLGAMDESMSETIEQLTMQNRRDKLLLKKTTDKELREQIAKDIRYRESKIEKLTKKQKAFDGAWNFYLIIEAVTLIAGIIAFFCIIK